MTQILPAAAPARLRVVHLVDDGNWGGVTRGMKFLGRDADLASDLRGDAAWRRIAEERGDAEFAVPPLA